MTHDPRQMDLFAGARPPLEAEGTASVVESSPVHRYAHLVHLGSDPLRRDVARLARATGAEAERTPAEWSQAILEHLSDGKERTFHTLALELLHTTAEQACGSAAEAGLWLAVQRGDLVFTRPAPLRFRLARSRNETLAVNK